MRAPDFFIAGAPKCGTSALYTYLKAHPEIFMSPIKEPHYFYTVSPRFRQISSAQRYHRLFAGAADGQLCGEASSCYLFSDAALQAVIAANPRAKMIAMVRNPIDMVVSFHRQKLYTFQEDVADFEAAWRLSEERAKGSRIPRACTAPEQLLYPRVGCMGDHIDRLMRIAPRQQVHVIVFDDLIADPATVYRDTLRFLGVRQLALDRFPIVNARKRHRWPRLSRFLMRPPFPFDHLKVAAKLYLGPKTKTLAGIVYPALSVGADRPQLSSAFLAALSCYFRDDVEKLSDLLGRDLRHWCDGYAL